MCVSCVYCEHALVLFACPFRAIFLACPCIHICAYTGVHAKGMSSTHKQSHQRCINLQPSHCTQPVLTSGSTTPLVCLFAGGDVQDDYQYSHPQNPLLQQTRPPAVNLVHHRQWPDKGLPNSVASSVYKLLVLSCENCNIESQ